MNKPVESKDQKVKKAKVIKESKPSVKESSFKKKKKVKKKYYLWNCICLFNF